MQTDQLEESVYSVIVKWWFELDYGRRQFKDKGEFRTHHSAALRRAKTVDDVILNCDAYHTLLRRVEKISSQTDERRERLAIVAAVAAHSRSNSPKNVAQHLKRLSAKSDSIEMRLKRLLQESEPDELMQAMIRVVKLVGNEVNIAHLATSLLNWNDPKTKKQWAYDFY
jgi:CRISPR type I-E-associated protein CasB/Cse2